MPAPGTHPGTFSGGLLERALALMKPHRALFVSDLHLGTGRCCAAALLQLLGSEPSERWILVGDILDLIAWQEQDPRFSSDELALLELFWQRQQAGELIWILGNHEEPLRRLRRQGLHRRSWIADQLIYHALDGRRLLVIHGDQLSFDGLQFNRIERIGLDLVTAMERLHRRLHPPLPSPTGLMLQSSSGRRLSQSFHRAQAEHAAAQQVEGIICGHIHAALLEQRADALIINTGCWTHPPGTVVVESAEGDWILIDAKGGRQSIRVDPCRASCAATPSR